MPERIYTLAAGRALEAQEETPFPTEDEFQALIAEHPELLDGAQIRPDNPRRWILISREKGVAQDQGDSARWSVDHLIVDQDGVPTLAELKSGSSREMRRGIIGQLLEYAAHAKNWTADELRDAFEKQADARGRDPADELAALLQTEDEPDADEFWKKVETNLAAQRLRLLFVADDIPDPLRRVVEFLNAQMENVEVLAVEIKQFHGESGRTLVPRVIGKTAARASPEKLTRQSFLDGIGNKGARETASRLIDTAEHSGALVEYRKTTATIRVKSPAWPRPISLAWLYLESATTGHMHAYTDFFIFGTGILDQRPPAELHALLERWTDLFSEDEFAQDVSGKGHKSWAISHNTVLDQQDLLAERLRKIIPELASLHVD